jgi:tetrapyrrole methylase family protein / MazG family protein
VDISSLLETVHALRGPDGCPWDKQQTHKSLRKYLLEECYEVLAVLDQIEDTSDLKRNSALREQFRDELGDLLFQVLLHSEMASETTDLTFGKVAQGLEQKLIRRHPHVFSRKNKNFTADQISEQWEETKQAEKRKASALDDIPPALPALQKAEKVIERVSKHGFQWPNLEGPLEKVAEELAEFAQEIQDWQLAPSEQKKQKLEAELGDVLFSLCNVAYFLKLNPEASLRSMLNRFEKRFRHVEDEVKKSGKEMKKCTLEELDVFWNQAKALEKK